MVIGRQCNVKGERAIYCERGVMYGRVKYGGVVGGRREKVLC